MMDGQLDDDGRGHAKSVPATANGREAKAVPFAERLSCTINEACEATGLGRTKPYELIATGQLTSPAAGLGLTPVPESFAVSSSKSFPRRTTTLSLFLNIPIFPVERRIAAHRCGFFRDIARPISH